MENGENVQVLGRGWVMQRENGPKHRSRSALTGLIKQLYVMDVTGGSTGYSLLEEVAFFLWPTL